MRVLAAGSLRSVWQPLMAQFPEHVDTQFGPAGLLRNVSKPVSRATCLPPPVSSILWRCSAPGGQRP